MLARLSESMIEKLNIFRGESFDSGEILLSY